MWRIHIIATDGYMWNLFCVKDFSIKVFAYTPIHIHTDGAFAINCAIMRLLANV